MKLVELFKNENINSLEEYKEYIEKVQHINKNCKAEGQLKNYFLEVSGFILTLKSVTDNVASGNIDKMSLEELKKLNADLFDDIVEENYDTSFGNPEFAVKVLGKDLGQYLGVIYAKLREKVEDAFSYKIFDMTSAIKLFIDVYGILSEEEYSLDKVKEAIEKEAIDTDELRCELYFRRIFDKSINYLGYLINNSDLSDLRYLYKYDSLIGTREIQIAEFFNSLSESQIDSMVKTYVDGYVRGYELAKLDLSSKKYVYIYYSIGFERMVKRAEESFKKLGLECVYMLYQPYYTNRQFKYDHRYDHALYLTEEYVKMRLDHYKAIGENIVINLDYMQDQLL